MGIWITASAILVCVGWCVLVGLRLQRLKTSIGRARDQYDRASTPAERSVSGQAHDNWVVELRSAEKTWWFVPVVAVVGKSSQDTLVIQDWR